MPKKAAHGGFEKCQKKSMVERKLRKRAREKILAFALQSYEKEKGSWWG